MAEQGFSVRLTARIDGYLAAMESAKKATKEVADGGVNFDRLGTKMTDVGLTLSKSVTLPMIAAGGIAIKMSSDYEASFARMEGLAGVTAGEVDGLKKSVLDLAGQTAQAPQKLADALYEASSAGLDTQGALQAVGVAAKGAAVGMGSAQDIVGLVASAVASYGKENITAAQATDILTASIKAGRADPEELAGSLGRILPIASQLGVSFDEVGGATAFLSNIMGNTSETVTALQGFFVQLLSPTKQGQQALLDMGTSVGELHAAIDQNGLMGALDLLRSKGFGANQDALRNLFPDVQAFQGALSLVNDTSGALTSTLDATKNSTGALDTAFGLASDTAGFKMKQAWAEVQVALIQAGDVIMPIVAGIADGIGHLAELFSGLSKPVQLIVVAFLGLVAAAGPLLMIAGSLIKNFQLVKTSFTEMAAGASTASLALGAIGVVMIAATAWYSDNARKKAELTAITNTFTDALKAEADGQKGAVDASIAASLNNPKLIEQAKVLGLTVSDLAKIIRGESVPAYAEWQQMAQDNTWSNLGADVDKVRFAFGTVNTALAPLNDGFENAKASAAQLAANQDQLGISTERTAAQIAAQTQNFNDQLGLTPDVAGGLDGVTASTDAVKAAQDEAARKADVFSTALQAQIDKLDQLYPKQYDAVQAKYDYRDSVEATLVKLDALNTTLGDHSAKQDEVRSATDAAKTAILDQAEKFGTLDGAAVGSEGAIRRQISSLEAQRDALAPGSPLRAFLDEYIADLKAIPSNIATILDLHISSGSVTTAAGDTIGQQTAKPGQAIRQAAGGYVRGGSNVLGTRGEIPGPAGDEVTLPIGNRSALQGWLSDPRVGPPIAAAWSGSSAKAAAVAPVTNNSVNMYGDIREEVDHEAFWQRANFALASIS